MEEKNKISIIVPIYNVEKYLDKCIQSIINQTYKNLEIILVDDGSPDNCGEICDKYAGMDGRIKVIHKKNGGLADARNYGIEQMTGDCVAFVDSDDYIHPQMYERMVYAMEQKNADIVISSWKHVYEDKDEDIKILSEKADISIWEKYSMQNMYFDNPDKRIMLTVAWNKLYKKDVFDTLRFPKGKVHEDEFTTFKTLYNADKVVYIDDELYFYLVRNVSIMGDFNLKRFDIFDAYCEKLRFYNENHENELMKKVVKISMHMLVQYNEWMDKSDKESKNKFIYYYNMLKKEIMKISKKTDCKFTMKMEIFMFSKSFSLYKAAWKLAHVLKKNN